MNYFYDQLLQPQQLQLFLQLQRGVHGVWWLVVGLVVVWGLVVVRSVIGHRSGFFGVEESGMPKILQNGFKHTFEQHWESSLH